MIFSFIIYVTKPDFYRKRLLKAWAKKQKCGSEISHVSEAPQLKNEREQDVSTPSLQSIPESTYHPIIQQKVVKVPLGGPGAHSKRCLGFGVTSIISPIPFWVFSLFGWSTMSYFTPPPVLQVIGGITVLAILVAGLVFGILSKTNSSKAGKLEPKNSVKKVGSVFAIFGIVINAISIAVIIIGPLVSSLLSNFPILI